MSNFQKIEKFDTRFYYLSPVGPNASPFSGPFEEVEDANMYDHPSDPPGQRRVCYTNLLDASGNPVPRKYRVRYTFKAVINIGHTEVSALNPQTQIPVECTFDIDYTVLPEQVTCDGCYSGLAQAAFDAYSEYYDYAYNYLISIGVPASDVCDAIGNLILPYADVPGGLFIPRNDPNFPQDVDGDVIYIEKCAGPAMKILPGFIPKPYEIDPVLNHMVQTGKLAYKWINQDGVTVKDGYDLIYLQQQFANDRLLHLQAKMDSSDWTTILDVVLFDSCQISPPDLLRMQTVTEWMEQEQLTSITEIYNISNSQVAEPLTVVKNSSSENFESVTMQLKIYPNPTNGRLNIQVNQEKILSVEVYNSLGGLVQNVKGIDSNELSLDLSQYDSGMYILKIVTQENIYNEQVKIK